MFEGVQDQFHQFLAASTPTGSGGGGGRLLASQSNTAAVAASATNLPLTAPHHHHHLSFSLHGCTTTPQSSSNNNIDYPIFDPFPPDHYPPQLLPPQPPPPPPPPTQHHHHNNSLPDQPLLLMHLQFSSSLHSRRGAAKQGGEDQAGVGGSTSTGFLSTSRLVLERERPVSSKSSSPSPLMVSPDSMRPWSSDEVIALFRIRSAMDNWFPEFTWEHISRKLEEIGFKRSAQKCREKFEEESSKYFTSAPKPTSFSTTTTTTSKSNGNSSATKNDDYRFFSELEELYDQQAHDDHDHHPLRHNHLHQQQGQPAVMPFIPRDIQNENEAVTADEQNHNQPGDRDHQGEPREELGRGEKAEEEQGEEKIGEEGVEENAGLEETHVENMMKDDQEDVEVVERIAKRERRSHGNSNYEKKFEMFKSFCEEMVRKMMAHQEELHNRILEDMTKQEEETMAREEAQKKREMERFETEMQSRAREQAMEGERQAKIVELLKNFAFKMSSNNNNAAAAAAADTAAVTVKAVPNASVSSPTSHCIPTSSNQMVYQNPSPNSAIQGSSANDVTTFCNDDSHSQTSNSLNTIAPTSDPSHNNTNTDDKKALTNYPRNPRLSKRPSSGNVRDCAQISTIANQSDIGRRWPRDEVLALINVRCNIDLNNNSISGDHSNHHGHDLRKKGGNHSSSSTRNKSLPLWERISRKMAEMGYRRSAKRCKEKWENINKYFRKTKDTKKKKRCVNSRTCPYFQQLSRLYSPGNTMGSSGVSDQGPVGSQDDADHDLASRDGCGGGGGCDDNQGERDDVNDNNDNGIASSCAGLSTPI